MSERDERKQAMLTKVRKLLNMARDGRGNEHESEIAMRQANRIMAEYGIEEAEADISALDAGEFVYGEAQCGPDGRAPEQGKIYRTMPGYAGVLAVGVAKFCDAIIARKETANGQMLVFKGEKDDVLLARWIFGCLIASIQHEQKASGWTARGDSNSFRMAACATLQKRLYALRAERQKIHEEAKAASNSRALVVVNRKALEVVARFGEQKTSARRASLRSSGAAIAGHAAGQKINIPSGRPIASANRAQLN